MRKSLDFATIRLERDKYLKSDRIHLDFELLEEIIHIIYRRRCHYFRVMGNDPEGIILPARIYMSLQRYRNEILNYLQIDKERRMTLFNLKIVCSGGSEISFIPQEGDVMTLISLEEMKREQNEKRK